MRSSYSGSVIGPKMSRETLPRMFMPAPWITRTLGIALSVESEWSVFYLTRSDQSGRAPRLGPAGGALGGPDARRASASPGHDVLGARHRDVLAQDRLEDLELLRTESPARRGRRTDRAVVLDEEELSAGLGLHVGHVPFGGPDRREPLEALAQ